MLVLVSAVVLISSIIYLAPVDPARLTFGQRSDAWTYRSREGLRALASLDQTFPGWHELTTCYRNLGWRINPGARIKHSAQFTNEAGETQEWSYIECEMTEPTTGQSGASRSI